MNDRHRKSADLEGGLQDLIKHGLTRQDNDRSLTEAFQETLDRTSPKTSGDLRDDKFEDDIDGGSEWI